MKRVLEPEIMDSEEQASAYSKADFSESNQLFVDSLFHDFGERLHHVLDIGCGPGDIPIRLARAKPAIEITAVDASEPMVKLARKAVEEVGLSDRIKIIKGRLPGLTLNRRFDAVLSKDLLHHLPDPLVFWKEIKRIAEEETVIYIMDLFRPESEEKARSIVEEVSGHEDDILKKDFYNSLLAAFTIEEIEQQLKDSGLDLSVEKAGGRHFIAKGLIKVS